MAIVEYQGIARLKRYEAAKAEAKEREARQAEADREAIEGHWAKLATRGSLKGQRPPRPIGEALNRQHSRALGLWAGAAERSLRPGQGKWEGLRARDNAFKELRKMGYSYPGIAMAYGLDHATVMTAVKGYRTYDYHGRCPQRATKKSK